MAKTLNEEATQTTTRTLVRFTFLAVFDGPQTKKHLAQVGDDIADLLRRAEEDLLSVSSDYASVTANVSDEQLDETPLIELFHAQSRPSRRRR